MSTTNNTAIHIPFLSDDEKLFLNTTAIFSQKRRMSSIEPLRSNTEDNTQQYNTNNNRRHHVKSMSSLSFLWKRRDSSSSSLSSASFDRLSVDTEAMHPSSPKSPKARELESLIFEQPQRTVRLSLTPRCAT